MSKTDQYDVTLIGGGLAGLALSIQLVQAGYTVVLFEKETYPFHKVCGEYISLESWNFLEQLGLPLASMNLPVIKNLLLSAPNGNVLKQTLPLGGFGISRYKLDENLKNIAVAAGVMVIENCKVDDVFFKNELFEVQTSSGIFYSKICCGCFGKRSKLDIKWKRYFITHKNNKLSNYIGVKYHIKTSFPVDTIALYNFKDGYCGLSKIEEDKYCLCYLTNAANLNANNNSIAEMEKNILFENRHLKKIFETSEFLYKSPVTISQLSFNKKSQVGNHILMLGDAAGMITPLCGNGMSMALHSSKIAAAQIIQYLSGAINRATMEKRYVNNWRKQFQKRLFTGRFIQHFFGKKWVTNLFVHVMKLFPFFARIIIKQTHGKAF